MEQILVRAEQALKAGGIGTARLDALVLLEDVTGRDRVWLLAHPEFELTAPQDQKLKKLLKRRAQHIPLAYVRGRSEFYGREFVITPAVLEPRPESETMIDMLKKLYQSGQKAYLADVGAGSGALGITAKLELPEMEVDLLEIDKAALKVAQTNVDKYTTGVRAMFSDLLTASDRQYDVLLCNLPYVPDDFKINTAALHEPRLAIYGGPDGLDVYRRLFSQLRHKPLYILCESLPFQHAELAAVAAGAGYRLQMEQDFIQLFNYSEK